MMKISSVSLFNSMLGLVLMALTPINSSAKDNTSILQATGLSDKVIEVTARPCYELCANRIKGIALGNMSMAKTTKCNPPSTSGSRS